MFEGTGLCSPSPCIGLLEIRPEIQRQMRDHVQVTSVSRQVSGATATGRIEVRANSVRAAGVERIIATDTLEVRGSKFARVRTALDTSDQQTAAFIAFRRQQAQASAAGAAATQDAGALYRSLVEAINRGDVAGILAQYADNAEFRGGTVCAPNPCTGRAAIQRHWDGIVSGQTVVNITNLDVRGNTVAFRTEVQSGATRAAQVQRVIASGEARYQDGRIVFHTIQFDGSDQQTATFLAFLQRQMQAGPPPAPGGGPIMGRGPMPGGGPILGGGPMLGRGPMPGQGPMPGRGPAVTQLPRTGTEGTAAPGVPANSGWMSIAVLVSVAALAGLGLRRRRAR
jgi:ketosteroid isomerase-like protein